MPFIDFGVTRSNVKVTGALNARTVSAYYFENYSKVSIFYILIGHN
jgi:hypothetical protein